ncbi:hypothetical protein CRE_23594 [Caenorhabditis remanei]|uniref:Uncharacterized protein n=1 Tax=Caenorhabditis remanei TaxID=31234 RepID=E3MVQ7_CAERE|nr:hypothetical protein CRE_23594 [Caenorhabditis remanei]
MKILQLLMATYPRNSPRPAPPPQVRWAPIVQITAHVSLCPGNPLVRVTLDLTPFERETYGTRPLQTFEMMDYRLVPCRPRAPAIVHPANAGVRAETFTGSTQTWVRRRAAENHGLRCCCDAMYSHPERRHDSKGMCTAWAVGQMIAEKIWAGDDIKPPMVHEPHPTTPPHNRRLWAPIVEIRVTVYRHRCGISVEAAVNQSPFGPVLQLADRVRFYHILDNQLWSVFENPFGYIPPSEDTTGTIGVTQAWTRRQLPIGLQLSCPCDHRYTPEHRGHNNPDLCLAWKVGQMIADRYWENESIDGMELPRELFVSGNSDHQPTRP